MSEETLQSKGWFVPGMACWGGSALIAVLIGMGLWFLGMLVIGEPMFGVLIAIWSGVVHFVAYAAIGIPLILLGCAKRWEWMWQKANAVKLGAAVGGGIGGILILTSNRWDIGTLIMPAMLVAYGVTTGLAAWWCRPWKEVK